MSEFLFRPLLEELTAVTNERGYDPYEAYAWLYEKAQENNLQGKTYASTSITSGGHARDNSLEMREIIKRNTKSARLLAEQLVVDRQIEASSTIEPVFIGKTHWTQSQYMEFWLSVIAGARLTPGSITQNLKLMRKLHREAYQRAEVDIDRMNAHASALERAEEYFKMAAATAGIYMEGKLDSRPMERVVRMIDTDQSLGAQAERVFARKLRINVMNISVIRSASPLELATVNHRLAKDTERLIQFGAAIFDTQQNQVRLQLVEELV
jgi:hypothetical protein